MKENSSRGSYYIKLDQRIVHMSSDKSVSTNSCGLGVSLFLCDDTFAEAYEAIFKVVR